MSLAFSRWPLRAIIVYLRRANLSLVLRTLVPQSERARCRACNTNTVIYLVGVWLLCARAAPTQLNLATRARTDNSRRMIVVMRARMTQIQEKSGAFWVGGV